MNLVLLLVVVGLWSKAAWDCRHTVITIKNPFKKVKKVQRKFKVFRYIETSKGIRCIEEQMSRVV